MKGYRKIILILVGATILSLIVANTAKMIILKKTGVQTSGVVISKQKIGSKGQYSCHYSYRANHETLFGKVVYNNLEKGDTIIVLYLSLFPSISVPKKFVDEYY